MHPNPNPFITDVNLEVTHHNFDQKKIFIALKLLGILASSLLLIGLMVTGLGISGSGCFDTEDVPKIDWKIIKKFLKILSLLLIIFTLIFFTFFGCFLVLNLVWGSLTVFHWYRHRDRVDRFLMCNKFGNLKY